MRVIRLLCVVMLGIVPLWAIPFTGRVRVSGKTWGIPRPTVVYAEPLGAAAVVQPGRFTLRQVKKTFLPKVIVVPVGSTVQFPNDDSIFHNVFSLSRPEPFDLGLYRAGASKTLTFTKPGAYNVFCNIHPQMSAIVAVVPTTYIAEADASGAYALDLPAGRYRITALSERARGSVEVTVAAGGVAAPDLEMQETSGPAGHTNKFGQEYPKSAFEGK